MDDDDFDAAISDDIKTIMSAIEKIKAKDQKYDQKKNEETISSVASDIKSSLDEFESEVEKERQIFDKALSKSSKEYQSLPNTEAAKFQEVYEKFSKEKAARLQALKDVISIYEEEKEKLFVRYEQLRKKIEKALLSEYEKANAARIAQLEESLKKKKQDDKTFSILRKNEETISSVASDIKSSLDELKSEVEKERCKALITKSSKECENLLKTEAAKFQEVREKFSKEKAAHRQALDDVISKYIEEDRRLSARFVQIMKKENALLSEHEKANAARIAQLEESLKKRKREDKIFSALTKTLGSSLGNASDEGLPT